MVEWTTVDAGAVYQRAARALATELGDGVIVSLRQPDGSVRLAAFDHHDPERAVIIGAMLRFGAMDAMYARRAVNAGELVFVPQVPQREVRGQVRPEFHQCLAHAGFYSAVSAPVIGSGVVRGTVLVSRDSPGRPYTVADCDFVAAVAARIGAAMAQAERGRVAWSLRARLASELANWIDDGDFARVIEWLDEVPGVEAVAIVDVDTTIAAATHAFAELFGTTVPECKERSVGELVDPALALEETLARLRDGELDYCTVVTRPVAGDHDGVVLDGAIIRQRDATPCCVLYVAHAIPEVTEAAAPDPLLAD
jgi:PAS domain-containing protein